MATIPALPQNPELQQKLAAVKEAAAENKQQLRQYQWTSGPKQSSFTLKGDAKPPTQNLCKYGPDGQVQKTPIGPPPDQPSVGFYNLFNFANFDLPGNMMNGLLTGAVPGELIRWQVSRPM